MTNQNTPQLSRMDLPNHCAAFPGLSRQNTRAVIGRLVNKRQQIEGTQRELDNEELYEHKFLRKGEGDVIRVGM
jgi:hypothetical protein